MNGTYVGMFPFAGYSSGIYTVLIDISKNLRHFLGILLLITRGEFNPGSCFSIPEVGIVNVVIVGVGFLPWSEISSVSSLFKTVENWLFNISALALRSVNTSFPPYGVVKKVRKIIVSGSTQVLV